MNPITFSTLACPAWSVETVIERARAFGYDGLEWRGGPDGHLRAEMTPEQRSAVRTMCADADLSMLAVTAYTSFVADSRDERQANVDELRRYIDLAADLGAQYVRAFLGELPAGSGPDETVYGYISESLRMAAEHALATKVTIAIEPHDNFARASAIVPVLERMDYYAPLRVIWDIANAYAAGDDPAESFAVLKDYVAYIQVKDGTGRGPHWQLCSVGQGEVPLGHAFELLLSNGYTGAFSVEWEYAWHPELASPEDELPAARKLITNLLADVRSSQRTN